jgi:hypothetical protein
MAVSSLMACYEAVQRILGARGVDSQNGTRAWCQGNYRFLRNNVGSVQVWVNGHLDFSMPLTGSSEPRIWNPGDWVVGVDQLDREVALGLK